MQSACDDSSSHESSPDEDSVAAAVEGISWLARTTLRSFCRCPCSAGEIVTVDEGCSQIT